MMAPDPPPSAGEVKNNNQLAMGASKVGDGWRESVVDHRTMIVGDNEQRAHAADVDGSKEEGESNKGNGE
jgi:hypothetical protein